ncbi:HWE histidine kinase domain-containing protein [Novosphingobium huizhouense]|uniref:HWE histidine kinase domain-containing protein n=1 Tax=Novosphingobium huizhouense TaxID=2866625 RepID=UPI001CD858BD|nr:HWE histidine kinase domain-containing protein [Novosphingobium huizhouense]
MAVASQGDAVFAEKPSLIAGSTGFVRSPTESRWFALRGRFRSHPALRLALPVTLVALAVVARILLGPWYAAPFIPFYPAILVSTLVGGRFAGNFSLALSLACSGYLFYHLSGALEVTDVPVALAMFGVVALTVIEILVQLTSLADRLREREVHLLAQAEELSRREVETAERLGELEAIYEQAPIGLGFLDDELRFVRINRALAEMNGHSVEDHIGKSAWDLVPDLRASAEPLLRSVLDCGVVINEVELSGETAAAPGNKRYWKEMFYPVRSGGARAGGVGILCEDITEAKLAEEREALLIGEVDHRAKNLLAVVQSVVQLTRYQGEPAAFKAAIVERIQALGRVHALLAAHRWSGVGLEEIIAQELAPFADAIDVRHLPQPVQLAPGAAQALSMVVHELLTNSIKYGALSSDGHVLLRLGLELADQPMISFDWTEIDGPPVAGPRAQGFGTKLIATAVQGTLAGELDYELRSEGLRCRIRFPRSAAESRTPGATFP